MQQLGHEKLHVYQHSVRFVSWGHAVLSEIDAAAAVLDHFDRASESIVDNLANGNSRRNRGDRNRYFDVALGSGLESAACLDVCLCKNLIRTEKQIEGKEQLRRIVRMIMRLREAPMGSVHEQREEYGSTDIVSESNDFYHEQLDVYQVALELVRWVDGQLGSMDLGGRYESQLDKYSTAVVLNIAEGNGRFSSLDHKRFIDIAYTAAMRVASTLDVMVARGLSNEQDQEEGKRLLVRLVPLILGLRGYLDQSGEKH